MNGKNHNRLYINDSARSTGRCPFYRQQNVRQFYNLIYIKVPKGFRVR